MKLKNLLLIAFIVFPTYALAEYNYKVPVLMYHDINNNPNDQYAVTPLKFGLQMLWLKDRGYKAIPLTEIDDAQPGDIVITFDDGYYSFINYALPILKKLEYHVTINLIGAWVGSVIPDITNKKALSWDDIKMLDDTGLVAFGSHTNNLHHFRMGGITSSTQSEMEKDFLNFQRTYKKHLGKLSPVIAWPFGHYNDAGINAGYVAKFEYFLTSNKGRYSGNRNSIPRLSVERDTDIEKLLGDN